MEQLFEWQARPRRPRPRRRASASQWQRTAADFANYKRRAEEDRFRELGLASEGLLRKVLGVSDDLGAGPGARATRPAGLGLGGGRRGHRAQAGGAPGGGRVTAIEAVGTLFDPRLHEAVSMEPTDEVPEGTVTRELQRGYQLRDRVLRPALVIVSTGT